MNKLEELKSRLNSDLCECLTMMKKVIEKGIEARPSGWAEAFMAEKNPVFVNVRMPDAVYQKIKDMAKAYEVEEYRIVSMFVDSMILDGLAYNAEKGYASIDKAIELSDKLVDTLFKGVDTNAEDNDQEPLQNNSDKLNRDGESGSPGSGDGEGTEQGTETKG